MSLVSIVTHPPLRIALIGYGVMGKELERLAPQYDCVVARIFTSELPLSDLVAKSYDFDVAIDFSRPEAVLNSTRLLCAAQKNVVIGTTGWLTGAGTKETLENEIMRSGTGAVYGSNFSVGVQMFFRIARYAAELAEEHDDYDAAIHEIHHRRKRDAPSGTALSAAALALEALSRKNGQLTETAHDKIEPNLLHVTSTRVGDTPGTHTLYLDSAADTIEITHRARSRAGFAAGALRAARWIAGRRGFYDFSEIFDKLRDE